jgi:hypothetical protein
MQLKTVASYIMPFQAEIARNALEDAGIRAVLQDAELAGTAGLYANAIGGVKLQVQDVDVERALEVLREFDGSDRIEIDQEELTRQALEADPDEGEEIESISTSNASEDSPAVTSPDDEETRRFRRMVILSLACPILMPFVLYAYLNLVTKRGTISAGARRWIIYSIILLPVTFLIWMQIPHLMW